MATRTQKAAIRKKAPQATTGEARAPKTAKPRKPASKPTEGLDSKATESGANHASVKPSLGERFWHRIGLSAQAKEQRAHEIHVRHEAELERQVQADRVAQERAAEDARAAKREHAAAERQARAKAGREMARLAREEDARMKREAQEAEARAVEEKAAQRLAAGQARREAAKQAKLLEAAEAAQAAEQKAAKRREAAEARREAARAAQAQAEEDAARAAEAAAAKRAAAAQARREAAAAKRAAAEQAKLDAAAEAERKVEERRLAKEAKLAEKAREEELALLEQEAVARRQAAKVQVEVRETAPAEAAEEPKQSDEDEAPKPSNGRAPDRAASGAPSQVDAQADNVADELRRRRSKPITIDAEDTPTPTLPVGRRAPGSAEAPKELLQLDPAPPARMENAAPRGLSIPEHYLLLAIEGEWDERREAANAGGLGGGLTGALLLELVHQGKIRVQRDRFQLTDTKVDEPAQAIAAKLAQFSDKPSLQAMAELAKWLPALLPAYKDRMATRGLLEHRAWRHLGLFYRSQTALLDADAQERLRAKLARAIAGGGRPDAPTILSLGLLEASGLFGVVVPEGAQQYNRKRLNGLLGGKDVMGYKVDDELKGFQEMAVRTILDNVRVMSVRG